VRLVRVTFGHHPADHVAVGVDRTQSLTEMAATARVRPGTYAYHLVESVHWGIFRGSLDLKQDYKTYFAIEYATFQEYLARRYRYATSAIASVGELFEECRMIFLYQPGMSIFGDDSGYDLLKSLLHP
jgi:hypothetical protein